MTEHTESLEQELKTAHQKKWEELAQKISSEGIPVDTELPHAAESLPGELIIIGSGIAALSFTIQDENYIQSADYVFYCVADPATSVWIKTIRPDAFDLYVLYNERYPRYTTYVQMSEAMLYYVRQGKHVVGIYYGHPGIFVLSTHRAIQIARREGYRAIMRPGISALDCLCADLGVDPSTPGLQTFEASDMLIRDKKPDTTAHVVLWQVGLIGEMGYRRLGYINNNFTYLVDYLKQFYGEDHAITNYIAARYPGVPPTIERYQIHDFYSLDVQHRVTGISTFYLPPKEVRPINVDTAVKLGLLKPDAVPGTPDSPLRKIAEYSKKEKRALRAFSHFKIPDGYLWQTKTLAADFIIKLVQDEKLRKIYEKDPVEALSTPSFSKLTEQEKIFLASKDSGRIQIAAKGLQNRSTENRVFLDELLVSSSVVQQILHTRELHLLQELFSQYNINQQSLHRDISWLETHNVYPWSGVYFDESTHVLLCVLAPPKGVHKILLQINRQPIRDAQYTQGCLKWSSIRGNPSGGMFYFVRTRNNKSMMIGNLSQNGTVRKISAVGVSPFPATADIAAQRTLLIHECMEKGGSGEFILRKKNNTSRQVLTLLIQENSIQIDSTELPNWKKEGHCITWGSAELDTQGKLTFVFDPLSHSLQCFGTEEPGYKLMGMKKALQNEKEPDSPLFSLGLPEEAQKDITQMSLSGRENGGILFWHNWLKIRRVNIALGKLVKLLEKR